MARISLPVVGIRSQVISESHVDLGPVNTVAETTLATHAIPTNPQAGDLFRFFLVGDLLNNSAAAVTYTFRFKIGATTVITSNALSMTNGVNRRRWWVDGLITVVSLTDQRMGLEAAVAAASTTVLSLSANTSSGAGFGTSAEDLSAGKNLVVTVQLGTADANADCICHQSVLDVVKRF